MAASAFLPSLLRAAPREACCIFTGQGTVSLRSEQKRKLLVSKESSALLMLKPRASHWCMTRNGFLPPYSRRKDEIPEPNPKQEKLRNRRSVISDAVLQDGVALTEDQEGRRIRKEFSKDALAKVLAIFGEGTISPFGGASWEEVMQQTARRIGWIDSSFEMVVLSDEEAKSPEFKEKFELLLQQSNIMMIINVQKEQSQKWLKSLSGRVPTQIAFDCMPDLDTFLGGSNLSSIGVLDELTAVLPGSNLTEKRRVLKLVRESWERQSPDNLWFAVLVLIDSFVTPVKLLKNLRATGLASLQCMVKNCGQQIFDCLKDPNCRKALDCLNKCAPTDQVCSYRCIVSYESPQLEQFTLCILQKHNCLGLDADILMEPDVQPMPSFRGQPLTYEIAEDLFIGWLNEFKWSWRVVAGQNAAYDQFPNQYQIFYRGKAKGSLWYDPVFQVRTLGGETVWRRRHYRVVRGATPGTFYFSVLDNGVVSKEFWRIVFVADDLSWGLFYYSGAAAAAGQSYTGAVLVTPDGAWPDVSQAERLNAALEACGIKLWELYRVENSPSSEHESAPLGLPEYARGRLSSV
ncbi:hypothetical protein R1sor_018577 [Riccia sorocarpa]|uniref:VDE lipocalin domain-containing protein n=1 Tax=Riccia sorocarpa TaxID=122646 RepID=A0ABD3IDN4_9MARC